MAKTEGTYIWVAYKNVFGYISTNSWPFFIIQRPTIREKCAWVRSKTWRDERPVATGFFGFLIFWQTSQLATKKIQNLCNRNQWSGLLQLGSVWFRSFFQSSELDPWTLTLFQGGIWAPYQFHDTMGWKFHTIPLSFQYHVTSYHTIGIIEAFQFHTIIPKLSWGVWGPFYKIWKLFLHAALLVHWAPSFVGRSFRFWLSS